MKEGYIVTDPEEERLLIAELNESNPTLTDEEIDDMLGLDGRLLIGRNP
ncbi:hypothetical protein [Sporosarcina sp. ITBMC105]